MASCDNPDVVERGAKDGDDEEKKGGFLDKVKGFIHDIGEKIEETVGFGKPTADVTAIHLPHINLEKADIVVDVLVTNPNPVPIPLIDIDYLIESDGRKLVSGLIPDAGTIHAHGSETVKIPLCLIYDDIKSTYADINPGMIIPYRIKVDLIVDVPVFGRLTLPLEKTGEIPIPYKPDVDVDKIHFEKFSWEETVANLHIKLENKNDFDMHLNDLDCEIWLCDVSIGCADLTQSAKIEKNGISYIDIPITFRPKDCGSALWDMIRGRGTGYSIKGNVHVDTPFGKMKLPIVKEGGTTRLKKDDDNDDEFSINQRAKNMFGFGKSPANKQPRQKSAGNSNPVDSDGESDQRNTITSARRTSSEPILATPNDSDDYFGRGSYSVSSKNNKKDLNSMSCQELEGYATNRSEETTNSVNNCLKIAEDMKQVGSRTLETLHHQGDQIHRTHVMAVDMERDLSKGEKLLNNLGGMFSKPWKPKKGKAITGPLTLKDDNQRGKRATIEQREKLGLAPLPKGRGSRTPPPEPTNFSQKVEMEKAKQDDGLSELSNIVSDLKGIAISMGSELERQNKALDHLDEDVDELDSRLKGANQRTRRLIGK